MGRYTGPVCRWCRREGMKLFLKGDRCNMAKCPIERERPVPGMHGAYRRTKQTDYARQFREKQRLKRSYGLQEGQFRGCFEKAHRHKGVTGELLLQALEMRLDNLVYRFGFAPSRRSARQFVHHNHVQVNGHKADVPSMVLKIGDSVQVKATDKSRAAAKRWLDAAEGKTLVPWLLLDRAGFTGRVQYMPSRDEIAPLVDEQLVIELCSK